MRIPSRSSDGSSFGDNLNAYSAGASFSTFRTRWVETRVSTGLSFLVGEEGSVRETEKDLAEEGLPQNPPGYVEMYFFAQD